jgi:hypothetical protein
MIDSLMIQRRLTIIAAAIVICFGSWVHRGHSDEQPGEEIAASKYAPRYTNKGALKLPGDFREWSFVGAALGLRYSDHGPYPDEEKFTNVYITPPAFAEFQRTGTFPEKTMLAMAVYRQGKKQPRGDLKLHGSYEGEFLAVELAVKDSARFDDAWSYFDFSPVAGQNRLRKSAKAFATNKCYDCHAAHAAVDNVFVQFYPTLRRLQKAKK